MENSKDIVDAVTFFQHAFTIVLALGLGEAFKQFVADKEERTIHWDRLPALLTFLFMIFPFFHGMNRYIYKTYIDQISSLPSYAYYLMFDGMIFMAESAIFFVMSRSLAVLQWRRFLFALISLVTTDSIWILVEWSKMPNGVLWLFCNFGIAVLSAGLLWRFRGVENSYWPLLIVAVATFLSTSISYYVLWRFYFPYPAAI